MHILHHTIASSFAACQVEAVERMLNCNFNNWERKHKKIPKEVFKNEKVKSVANCKACHSDIEKGLIENENIKDISDFM